MAPQAPHSELRGFACAVRGEARGRSTVARLELAGYDPAADMAIRPIVGWARALWDSFVPRNELQLVWKKAHREVAVSRVPFRQVLGTGGAMVASALRIGWKCHSNRHFINASGDV